MTSFRRQSFFGPLVNLNRKMQCIGISVRVIAVVAAFVTLQTAFCDDVSFDGTEKDMRDAIFYESSAGNRQSCSTDGDCDGKQFCIRYSQCSTGYCGCRLRALSEYPYYYEDGQCFERKRLHLGDSCSMRQPLVFENVYLVCNSSGSVVCSVLASESGGECVPLGLAKNAVCDPSDTAVEDQCRAPLICNRYTKTCLEPQPAGGLCDVDVTDCDGSQSYDCVSNRCVQRQLHGETCVVSVDLPNGDDCHANMLCSDTTDKCVCQTGFYNHGAACRKSDLSESCSESTQCATLYSECRDSICQCKNDYSQVTDVNGGKICLRETVSFDVGLGQECTHSYPVKYAKLGNYYRSTFLGSIADGENKKICRSGYYCDACPDTVAKSCHKYPGSQGMRLLPDMESMIFVLINVFSFM